MPKSRKKLFIENFLAYGAINALDKIVPLVMLPIVTRFLKNTADYGRFEMFNTIVGFGSSFAILGMYDAMFREYFEKDDTKYRSLVTSTALRIVLISASILSLILIVFSRYVSQLFLGNTVNGAIVIMAALGVFLASLRTIVSAPTRMKNKRKVYIFSGISYSLIYYLIAIFLIRNGFSYNGMIYGSLIASLYLLFFFYFLNRFDFNLSLFNNHVSKELFKIGVPLIPVFVIYWAFQSMDKIMIANMLGLDQVGIYSIGAKVASVSNFIYMAFAGGWQYFAFSTMKDNDQVELTSKVFEYLGVFSFFIFAIAILFNDFAFNIFFTGDYTKGSTVFPYLFLSPLLLMLFQTAGNQLLVVKKTYLSTICLAGGLFANLILNYLMIPRFGIRGAALATLIGYTISVIAMIILTYKLSLTHIQSRFFGPVIAVVTVLMLVFLSQSHYTKYSSLIIIFFIFIFYKNDLHKISLTN